MWAHARCDMRLCVLMREGPVKNGVADPNGREERVGRVGGRSEQRRRLVRQERGEGRAQLWPREVPVVHSWRWHRSA